MPQTPTTVDPMDTMHVLTEEDQQILAGMVSTDGETTFEVRPDIAPKLILRNLYIATRGAVMLERKRSKLLHIIGRILHVIKNNPSIYTGLGYRSFDLFLKKHVTEALGMGKTTLQSAIKIYEVFPTVNAETIAEVGTVKMHLLSKATSSEQPGHVDMIERAKTMSTSEVIQMVAEKGGLSVGDILRDVVTIQTSKSVKKMWREFTENPLVRAYCQTEDHGIILEFMMGECLNEWMNRSQDPKAGYVPQPCDFPI